MLSNLQITLLLISGIVIVLELIVSIIIHEDNRKWKNRSKVLIVFIGVLAIIVTGYQTSESIVEENQKDMLVQKGDSIHNKVMISKFNSLKKRYDSLLIHNRILEKNQNYQIQRIDSLL